MRLQVSRMLLLLAHRVSRDQGRGLLLELRRCAGRNGTRCVGRRGVLVLMTCPECGAGMRVADTHTSGTDKAPTTERVRTCPCGERYLTEEWIKRRLTPIRSPNSSHSAISGNRATTEPLPTDNGTTVNEQPNDGKKAANGENTTLFLDPIRSDPAPLSDLRLDLSQEVDREKAAYEQDFLLFWDAIEPIGRRKGDKAEAQKVWRKKRRPNSANLIIGWRRYRNSCGDGYTMDADRWLRNDGWLKEWEAAPAERTNGISSQYSKIKELPPGVLPPQRPRP